MSQNKACPKCGASGFSLCKEMPSTQVNLAGRGWRTVPRRAQYCIRSQEAADELGEIIKKAYQTVAPTIKRESSNEHVDQRILDTLLRKGQAA